MLDLDLKMKGQSHENIISYGKEKACDAIVDKKHSTLFYLCY